MDLYFLIAMKVDDILASQNIPQDARQHIFDRLVDRLAADTAQELAALYGMLVPENSEFVFIREGRVSSPKEPNVIAYRKV